MPFGFEPSYAIPLPLPSYDTVLDACVAFEFNIDRTIEKQGCASARVLLSHSVKRKRDALSRISYGDCLFDCLGLSADERLRLAMRAQASNGYIICKTKYGTAILITRLIASHGIALLLMPERAVSITLGRIPCEGEISFSKLFRLCSDDNEDSTAFKMASQLLLLVERSIIYSRSASEKECLSFEISGALYSTAQLLGIHPSTYSPSASSVDADPSEFICFIYLFSMISAKFGSGEGLGVAVTKMGKQSTARFFVSLKAADDVALLAEHPEIKLPIELMRELGIWESCSLTEAADSDGVVLEVSALLCRADPSAIGLKHPRQELHIGSAQVFLSDIYYATSPKIENGLTV